MRESGGTNVGADALVPAETRGFRGWFRQTFAKWLLIVPVLQAVAVYRLSRADVWVFATSKGTKSLFEIVHPSILVLFTLIAALRFAATRSFLFGWMTALGVVFFCREMHFTGSGVILVGGLLILGWMLAQRTDERRSFFAQRWAGSFFAMCVVTYFLSQLLDRGVVDRIYQAIVFDFDRKLRHGSNMEESMEALGGAFLLLSGIFARKRG